jgi:hypothetical protein
MAALPSRPCCGVLLLLLVLILLVVSRRQTGAAGRTDVPDLDRVVLRPASPLRPMPVAAASQPSSARSGSSACGRRAGTNHSASDVFEMAFYINAEGSLRRQKFMEVRVRLGMRDFNLIHTSIFNLIHTRGTTTESCPSPPKYRTVAPPLLRVSVPAPPMEGHGGARPPWVLSLRTEASLGHRDCCLHACATWAFAGCCVCVRGCA